MQVGWSPQPRMVYNHQDVRLLMIMVHGIKLHRGFADNTGQRLGRRILTTFLPDLTWLEVLRNGKNPVVTRQFRLTIALQLSVLRQFEIWAFVFPLRQSLRFYAPTIEDELAHERLIRRLVFRPRQNQPMLLEQFLIRNANEVSYLLDHSPHWSVGLD